MPHYIFQISRPLDEAFGWLATTARGIQPMLWTVDGGPHKVPYVYDGELPRSIQNQDVTAYEGTAAAQAATRVGTGCQASSADGYLVSDSFESCIPVVGLSATRTYLAHMNGWGNREALFSTWEQNMRVMIVKKSAPANHANLIEPLRQFLHGKFTGGAFVQATGWGGVSTAVMVRRSTCIAYRQD